jgi:hypothetical protein
MAAISSTSSSQAATQVGLQQLKLQQARQNAERAEQTARSLQSQAASASLVADRAQEDARTLAVQASQAQSSAGQARQGLAIIKSTVQMQTQLASKVEQVVERQPSAPLTQAPQASSAPVASTQQVVDRTQQMQAVVQPAQETPAPQKSLINAVGEIIGRVINTTA